MCESKKHLLSQCPHSWENMTNMTNLAKGDTSDDESLFSIGQVGANLGEQGKEENGDEAVCNMTKEERRLLEAVVALCHTGHRM